MTPNTIDPPASRPDSRGDTARAFVALGLSLWALWALIVTPALVFLSGSGADPGAPPLFSDASYFIPALALAGGGWLVLLVLAYARRSRGRAAGLAATVGLLLATLGTFPPSLLILGVLGGEGVLIWGAGRWLWRAHPGWAAGLVAAALLLAGGSEFYLAGAPARPVVFDPSHGARPGEVVLHPGAVVELTLACPAGRVPRYRHFDTEVLSPGPLGLLRQGTPVVRYMGLLPGRSHILIFCYGASFSGDELEDLTFSVTPW
ncbi:MAG TPA: hypothetical protein VKY74_23185 [Chloroflexia bacterium]|nr:hypothetical protein [Chloroflexia bacterium]